MRSSARGRIRSERRGAVKYIDLRMCQGQYDRRDALGDSRRDLFLVVPSSRIASISPASRSRPIADSALEMVTRGELLLHAQNPPDGILRLRVANTLATTWSQCILSGRFRSMLANVRIADTSSSGSTGFCN